jgi:hypothetical protein
VAKSAPLIQVGRFVLRKVDEKKRAMAIAALQPQPKKKEIPTLPSLCKDIRKEWNRCRALTTKGTRCTRGRELHNFFCGQHDPTDLLPETYLSIARVHEFLAHFGFTGSVYRFEGEYKISFTPARILYRGSTGITHSAFGTPAQWLRAWMKAHEIAHMPTNCNHCGKKFRLVDGKGLQCVCEAVVCNDCLLIHRETLDHLVSKPVMDAAKEDCPKLERTVLRNLESIASLDLIHKNGRVGGLPAHFSTRQKRKVMLIWTQNALADRLPGGEDDGT